MSENRFFVCEKCGNLVGMINDSGVPMMCCGQQMTHIKPNHTDGAKEKHKPVVTVEGNAVKAKIGDVLHPMSSDHSIMWAYLQTDRGGQRKCFEENSTPEVTFLLNDENPVAVYAYCNLHGLWRTEIQ
ncbi:MAG: desulfoferrodoxin [Clostridia bacterium]|nr:desulfoferrodoxin [Clostridia bacterium]